MYVETVRSLHGYNEWAMERVLASAEALIPDEFVAEDDTPHGSIRNQFVHVINTHWSWRSWCDNSMSGEEAYALTLDLADFADSRSVRDKWHEIRDQNRRFLSRATGDDMQRLLEVEAEWISFSLPVWKIMMHIANHSMQHRTEIAMSLTKLGQSPGDLDYLFYALEDGSDSPS